MPLQKRDERGEEDFGVAEERSAGKRARVSAPAWHEDDNEEEDEQRLRQQFEERNGALPGWAQQDVAPPSVFSTTANVLRSVGANVLLDPKVSFGKECFSSVAALT
jgi:hypothetical protein